MVITKMLPDRSMPSDLWSAGCIIAELWHGELLFATHSNTEHLALIERCVGPFPRHLIDKSRYAKKYFDRNGRSRWETALPRDGRDHVRDMPSLAQFTDRNRNRDLYDLLKGLLTIDPHSRLSAKHALRNCAFLRE
jgi:serine/threonine protein kinase